MAETANATAEFVYTRTFDASREDVWSAFTQTEHLKHWWGIPGAALNITHFDLKVGGSFLYRMELPDRRTMWARSVFREIVSPSHLVWLNGFADESGALTTNPWIPTYPLETVNTVNLEEQHGKTLLTLTVVPFNASREESAVFTAGINGMRWGLGAVYEGLATYLAKRG